jgi:predicted TPR repeat methyltransferase
VQLNPVLNSVNRYYTDKLHRHGTTHAGVDWNSPESQLLRFDQLLKIISSKDPFSLTDYGCGYGALRDYLTRTGLPADYQGYDISAAMIEKAKDLHESVRDCTFVASDADLHPTDYAVASGIFNVKLEIETEEWEQHILQTVTRLNELGTRGFAFNVLTAYSDPDRRRPTLYYADPCRYFDYVKKTFSRNVALLHDYDLYEFTLLVRK